MAGSLRRHQTTTLALLFLAGVVNFFDRSSLSIANTTVRAELHLNATEMGWLLSAFSLAYGLAQLPLVGLLDRLGTRAVLGVGLVVWSGAQLLTGWVRGLPSFLGLRVVLGAGEAPFYPAGVRSTREWFSERARARAVATMNSSQMLGLAVAPPLLTWAMLRFGWRAMFAGLGVAGLAVAIAWMALHRERGSTEHAEASDKHDACGDTRVWRALLRQKMVWGMMLGWGGINYTAWLYLAWLPGYLEGARHLSLAQSGWVVALPFLAGAVGMHASGLLSDWRRKTGATTLPQIHRENLIGGMVASALGTLLVAHARSTPEAVAGVSAALFAIHFAGTSGWGYVQAVSGAEHVASLGALQNFAGFMIASVAPVMTGWIVDRTHSFAPAFVVCSAVTVLGALSYATLARTPQKDTMRRTQSA